MPNIGGRRSPYASAGRGQARQTGRSMAGNRGGYGQGMDRRGGARTGALSRASKPFGMRGRMGGGMNRPSGMRGGRSPLGNLGGRSIFGNRGRFAGRPGGGNQTRTMNDILGLGGNTMPNVGGRGRRGAPQTPYSGMTTPRANRKGRFAGGSSGPGRSRRRGY